MIDEDETGEEPPLSGTSESEPPPPHAARDNAIILKVPRRTLRVIALP